MLIFIICLMPLVGGVYGVLHDQLTYTICPEYYTKFKFYQFGLMATGNEAIFPNPRVQVSIVGFLATWWMGVPVGLTLGLIGLVHRDQKQMLKSTSKATLVTLAVTLCVGLMGLGYGYFYLSNTEVNWWFPKNLIDKKSFVTVGEMHNFSYLGGILGLLIGGIYNLRLRSK